MSTLLPSFYNHRTYNNPRGSSASPRELPSTSLIEYSVLSRAIAEAICPVSESHYQGIECIVGKSLRHQIPMAQPVDDEIWPVPAEFQAVLLSKDGRTLVRQYEIPLAKFIFFLFGSILNRPGF